MTGLVVHVLLFLALCVPIVVMGAFYSERDDRRAFALVPRRLLVFVGSCALVAAVMLALEMLFVPIG